MPRVQSVSLRSISLVLFGAFVFVLWGVMLLGRVGGGCGGNEWRM